jgi:PAS domain S-box-containing protein
MKSTSDPGVGYPSGQQVTDNGVVRVALAEALIAAAGDGLVAVDRSGEVVVFNPAAGRIFGVDPESMIGQTLDRLFQPGEYERHQRYIDRYFAGDGSGSVGSTLEVEGWHREGRPVPLEISLSATTAAGHQLVLASIRDVSARKEAARRNQELMQQLTQAQKMEALGTLTAGIAHDFNTNLQTILGFASALIKELPEGQRHHQDVKQILNAVQASMGLVKKLLDYGRKSQERLEVLSLNRVVRDVVGLLRRSLPADVRIKTRLARNIHTQGDPIWLQHALMNICLNARDAMPDGGELHLQTRNVELCAEEASARGLEPGRYCELTASDTGQGMPPDILQRIFDPFFSTKPRGEGSGLGLAMVQTTVVSHGGSVSASSEPGVGTQFTIYLPATDAVPSQRRPAPAAEAPHGNGETILLVDDEQHLREMAERLLSGLGYQVLLAESGEEAVAVYRKHHQQIALVVLDMVMTGIDGAETLVRLRRLDQGVKVLASSGYRKDAQPQRLLKMGVSGFLQKPYGIEEISQTIRQALDS